jgi:actin related protein 2/3 complex subunit 2
MTVADFDGVTYHISTQDNKNIIHISLGWACTGELFSHGAKEILKREYGDLLLETSEHGYDVTLSIDLEKVSTEPGKTYIMVYF